jgi:hypothetical protein
MARTRKSTPAKPHSRAKARARDVAAVDPDVAWAKGISDRLIADCHPYQVDAVLDPARRISMLAGRGGGKTTVFRVRALRKLTGRRRARVAYVATSRPEAERLNWEPTKELISQLGEMDNFDFAEQKMRLTCKRTGGTYQFFGADDKREINKLRGQPFDEFQPDEAASFDPVLLEDMIDRAVGPRLGERDGCIVIGGTPGHVLYGLFYDVTRPGSDQHRPYRERNDPAFKDWIGWSSHDWDLFDIMALPNAAKRYPAMAKNYADALLTKARKKWGDDNPIWLREYRRRWAADNTTTMYAYRAHDEHGAPFNQWDPLGWSALDWDAYRSMEFPEQATRAVTMARTAIAKVPRELQGELLFGFGMDLGARDPFALNVRAFSPSDPERRFWHVCSFDRRKMYARLIAELLIGPVAVAKVLRGETYDDEDLGGLFRVTGWPVAIVADLAALGETIIDELQNVYGIKIKAAEKKGKFGAIEVVNGDFADRRAYILAGSELERQLSTLQWKPDEYGQPKEDRSARNDHADSDTYIRTEIGRMFAGVGEKPDDQAEAEDRKRSPSKKPAPPPPKDPWGDKPRGRRARGEFDSLMADDDFSGLE